jgi:hypothetical protein
MRIDIVTFLGIRQRYRGCVRATESWDLHLQNRPSVNDEWRDTGIRPDSWRGSYSFLSGW